MNKFSLVLIFSVIAFIKGTITVDDFNTEPYHSFDWLDEDDYTFEIKSSTTVDSKSFCYLYNSSVLCKPECTPSDDKKTISCKLVGDTCKADGDNPSFKYYYATYCSESDSDDFKKELTADKLLTYVKNHGPSGDVGVTIAVCSGSYLKYSLFLLSLLIL